jgi:hypothetical protein
MNLTKHLANAYTLVCLQAIQLYENCYVASFIASSRPTMFKGIMYIFSLSLNIHLRSKNVFNKSYSSNEIFSGSHLCQDGTNFKRLGNVTVSIIRD